MDPIQQRYFWLRDCCEAMPDDCFWLIFRLMLVVTIPTILSALAFAQGSRSTLVQLPMLVAGVLIALVLPFSHPPQNADAKTWTVVFSVVLLLITPAILPFFLVRRYAWQNRVRVALYCALGITFLMEVL